MRLWRALKAQGCAPLRDGAYLLPAGKGRAEALRELADDCGREGGVAWLMAAQPLSVDETAAWRALFDRSEDYAQQRKAWKDANRGLSGLSAAELARLQRKLQREYEGVRAIDFFPGEATAEAQAAWQDFNNRITRLLSPDEPHETQRAIPRLDPADFQGRTWATRRRLWVDRVASAWLIQRFIDPGARFVWLARPADCPRKALGFDFDGATFTHVGDRVTFETLLASFGLEDDTALVRLGALVRQLDAGGDPVPEAAGFEAVMTGARERLEDDDAMLAEMGVVLDSLHAHYTRAVRNNRT
jgi:hypothetical protein